MIRRAIRVVIDGNIGSGKTTQLGLLEKKGYTVRREAIHDWPLDEFYTDPARWAFLLHMNILLSNQPGEGVQLVERSLLSSRWVFWEVLKKEGKEHDENPVIHPFNKIDILIEDQLELEPYATNAEVDGTVGDYMELVI